MGIIQFYKCDWYKRFFYRNAALSGQLRQLTELNMDKDNEIARCVSGKLITLKVCFRLLCFSFVRLPIRLLFETNFLLGKINLTGSRYNYVVWENSANLISVISVASFISLDYCTFT
jgi:hypothetical protein